MTAPKTHQHPYTFASSTPTIQVRGRGTFKYISPTAFISIHGFDSSNPSSGMDMCTMKSTQHKRDELIRDPVRNGNAWLVVEEEAEKLRKDGEMKTLR
jgi:hypothetical protein